MEQPEGLELPEMADKFPLSYVINGMLCLGTFLLMVASFIVPTMLYNSLRTELVSLVQSRATPASVADNARDLAGLESDVRALTEALAKAEGVLTNQRDWIVTTRERATAETSELRGRIEQLTDRAEQLARRIPNAEQ